MTKEIMTPEESKISFADMDRIQSAFSEAERNLLAIEPTGEGYEATRVYEELEWFRDELIKEKSRNAELIEALESIRGIEAWINDQEMKELFQKKVYEALKSKGH